MSTDPEHSTLAVSWIGTSHHGANASGFSRLNGTSMATGNWKISGDYIESCNCDYLCPCIYTNPQGPATHDNCVALMAFRIDQGQFENVALSGLRFAFVIRSGRVMADGDWLFASVIDESADDAQRRALSTIVGGEAGGVPGRIHDGLVGDYRGVQFKPIEFDQEGVKGTVDIPGVLSYAIEGTLSRSGSGQPLFIDNTSHPANSRLALARSSHMRVDGFGIDLKLEGEGNNGHFAPFSWSAN
jgi:hypothetical protein